MAVDLMQDPYFRDFHLRLRGGNLVYPQLITNTQSGNVRYELYEGDATPALNPEAKPTEEIDPIEVLKHLFNGGAVRMGAEGMDPEPYRLEDESVEAHGMSDDLRVILHGKGIPTTDGDWRQK